ncbi:MAG: hypothetical protein QOI95_565 [Acidimicrobiaceae bacterium]|jgi:hypothetical protein
MFVVLLPLAVLVVGYFVVELARRDEVVELPWLTRGPTAGAHPAPQVAASSTGNARSVVVSLGAVEGRRLALHPAFALGIGFCVLLDLLTFVALEGGQNTSWRELLNQFPIFVHPLVGMTIVAVFRNTLRSRRDGTEELFASTPTSRATRTVGHLATVWVPVLAALAFLASILVLDLRNSRLVFGPIDGATVADVGAGLVLVAGGVALGVALARWFPRSLTPFIALVGIALLSTRLGGIGEDHWSHTRQLSTWPRFPEHDLVFTARPAGWHVVYLIGLVALVGGIAVLRDRRDRAVLAMGAIAVLVTAIAALVETRPIGATDASVIASMISHPDRHQVCVDVGRARTCAYADYRELATFYAPRVAAVLAAAPPYAVARDLAARQLFGRGAEEVDPAVRARLDGIAQADGHTIQLPYRVDAEAERGVRLRAALWAVGIATRDLEDPCPLAGRAQGVVALWLAFQDRPASEAYGLVHGAEVADGGTATVSYAEGFAFPADANAADLGRAPVVWSAPDLAAARALLAMDDDHVRTQLHASWNRFTDPATPTDVLLVALGLDPVGGASPATPVGEARCA